MKKLLIIIALNVLNTGIYAQKVFDEAVAKGILERMTQDPSTFFNNETDPNFTMVFDNGKINTSADVAKNLSNVTYKRNELSQKIRQIGNTAIVSGIVAESFYSKTEPTKLIFSDKEVYTYTYAYNKGKWLWVAAQHTAVPTPFTKETLNEILAEYKTDSKEFMNSHLSEDWRYINFRSGYQARKDFIGGTKQNILTTEMLDPVIFQSGNLAVTSGIHQTVRTTSDGKQVTGQVGATYTWQNRNGKWMFVASQQNAVAPATFDEAAFKGIMAGWEKDPSNFFKNEIDPKAIFTNGKGELMTQAQLAAAFGSGTSLNKKNVEELKVYQSGNTGVATGKTVESYNNGEFLYTGKFTYTFSQQNGKWVMASAQHTDFRSPKDEDEAAIKSTIESETLAGWAHDIENEFSYWKQSDNTSWVGGAQNKAYSFVGFENIKKTAINMHKNTKVATLPTLKNTDYSITINSNSAFVTYIQAQISKGKTSKTRENRYLEKINGNWKIVNATFIVDGSSK